MGRTIKLLLYYFAYQLAFMGVFLCGYMIFHHTTELPQSTDSTYITLILLAQVLSTAAVGIHLIVGKYVPLDRKTWAYYNSGKVLIAAILLIVGMGLWSNYLNELADLPNNMQEIFAMMMQHPLGVVAITIMAPVVEELLFRGAIQGHLLRKWKKPLWAIVVSSLIFGIVHGNWVQAPFAFVVGLALGWIYYHTGSLLPGILMHFVNNSTAVSAFGFPMIRMPQWFLPTVSKEPHSWLLQERYLLSYVSSTSKNNFHNLQHGEKNNPQVQSNNTPNL